MFQNSRLLMCGAWLLLALCLLAGCAAMRPNHNENRDESAQFRNYTFHPSPAAPSWPSFSAEDYRTFHKEKLTRSEVSLIRKTLSLVKACQQPLLRFAFPSNAVPGFPFALFFSDAGFGVAHMFFGHIICTTSQWKAKSSRHLVSNLIGTAYATMFNTPRATAGTCTNI